MVSLEFLEFGIILAVAIRLDPDDIKSVETIAQQKGLSYTALLRMWIKEYLAKEVRHID